MLRIFSFSFMIGMLLSCSSEKPKPDSHTSPIAVPEGMSASFYLSYNSLAGDFDGDGTTDSIQQLLINSKGERIHQLPRELGTDVEALQDYLKENKIQLVLRLKERPASVINLGEALDLFALINPGDLNGDLKDELAVVVDYPDESSVNTCTIYSLCSDNWIEMKKINIHESAFIGDDVITPARDGINDYLEKKDKVWMYRDYLELLENEELPFKKLELLKCGEMHP